jgi:hypothetical protein
MLVDVKRGILGKRMRLDAVKPWYNVTVTTPRRCVIVGVSDRPLNKKDVLITYVLCFSIFVGTMEWVRIMAQLW